MELRYFFNTKLRPALRKVYYIMFSSLLNMLTYLFFWIRPQKIDIDRIEKILIVKLERIGDLILSTPAIREIRRKLPKSSITVIASPYTKPIIEKNPSIDNILEYRLKSSLLDRIRFIRNIRTQKFDLAIDLNTRNFSFIPVWLVSLSKAKITIGLNNHGRAFLYNIKVKPYPVIEAYPKEVMHILEPLGIKSDDYKPKLFVSKENEEFIRNFFIEKGIDDSVLKVVIHPGGYYEALRWEEKNYAKVSEYIINNYKAVIFFIGVEREYALVERIIASINSKIKPLNLSGKLSLGQSMALIAKANLFIGNSSGPLHIACGLDVPTISFLGPSIPKRWRPQGEKNIVFRGRLSDGNYEIEYSQNKDFRSLDKVEIEKVIKAVDKQIHTVK